MLEHVLIYALGIAVIVCAVLGLLLKNQSNRLVALEEKAAILKVDKDLAKVKESSDESETEYDASKSAYDRLKSNFLSVLKSKK